MEVLIAILFIAAGLALGYVLPRYFDPRKTLVVMIVIGLILMVVVPLWLIVTA